ncbi:DUF2459 domain-containing protein [Candidatus Uabimicrobium sp. HlEnr_7]|uniref:DUF2459 domain-containing protein n=1 Tax=Candidatus Uabimicrobium helgolandensis TaxID=3095367 RepID=UPI003557E49C
MKKVYKYTKISILTFLGTVVVYLLVALLCSYITVNSPKVEKTTHQVFLNSNGIHLDIVFRKQDLSSIFLKGIVHNSSEHYLSFGWGDKKFYLETPTWGEFSIKNALQALFWYSETLVHVTRYYHKQDHWVAISVTTKQLQDLASFVENSFYVSNSSKQILDVSYHLYDNFYKAKGSYCCFYTCNTWTNSALKNSDIKACLWTPFSFRLMDIHRNLSKK